MASYFVASAALPDAPPSVHDRDRCPPGRFPREHAEYLGEFLDIRQALAVARLRFPGAGPCACCAPVAVGAAAVSMFLTIVRP